MIIYSFHLICLILLLVLYSVLLTLTLHLNFLKTRWHNSCPPVYERPVAGLLLMCVLMFCFLLTDDLDSICFPVGDDKDALTVPLTDVNLNMQSKLKSGRRGVGEGGVHLLEEGRDGLVSDKSLIDQMCGHLV